MIGKLNEKKALSLLMEFLSIEGITGKEKLIAKAVEHSLISFGVPKKFIFVTIISFITIESTN